MIGFARNELSEETLTKFVELRPRKYNCLKDDDSKDKNLKETKKCVIKQRLNWMTTTIA